MTSQMKTIDLLRHGEPVGGDVLRGRTDHELSDLGWQQMQQAVDQQSWDLIVSSPLKRCQAFSEKLALDLNIDLITAPDLQEFDYGLWENKPVDQVFTKDNKDAQAIWQDPMNFAAPEGESILSFEKRVLKAWFGCLARPEDNILVVCHGGVIRILLKEILGLPFTSINRLEVPFAGRSKVKVSHSEPYSYRLVTHG